jgi:thiamine-monophosphate kinase
MPVAEFELIRRLTADLPSSPSVVVGPGDDCAVVDAGWSDEWLLLKTDAVVEGVHFTADTPAAKVGHKALARCLSDIAAMAGSPAWVLITLGLPNADADASWALDVYAGLRALAARWNVAIVGGETTRHPGGRFLSLALTGRVSKTRCVLRRGARPGDAIFVTGELGGSLGGKHLEFEPRIVEAQWLASRGWLHCLIDLSDGLAGDLRHILEASGAGAELHAQAIPVSREAVSRARSVGGAKPPLVAALTDGEDFELLFTVASKDAVPLLDAWKQRFPALRLSCIGRVADRPGIQLRTERGTQALTQHGYTHFAQS